MGKYFGTDGFRGEAGAVLTSEHAFKIGRYLGHYLNAGKENEQNRARAVIGKDTRLSSYTLEYAIASGLSSAGVDVYLLHVTTTPSVSYVATREGFDLGIMITASHNPFYDNGIKIIDSNGRKLSEDVTDGIEMYLDAKDDTLGFASGADIGRICDHYAGRNGYVGRLISSASGSYKDLKIGLDTANGAAFSIANAVFSALGADVYPIHNEPNGLNVNCHCGSTHPESLSKTVKEKGLSLGFAFDGDADRCIAVDENGDIIDGDGILYVLAKRMKRLGKLTPPTIVNTVMSNGGLKASLRVCGIDVVSTQVGDRFVYECMLEKGIALGGEQSGHVIMRDLSATGDGILTAIMLTEEILDTGLTLSKLCQGFTALPQSICSVRVKDKDMAINDAELQSLKVDFLSQNEDLRRLIVRKSGTEPSIRIMAEAEKKDICDKIVANICSLLKKRGYIDV